MPAAASFFKNLATPQKLSSSSTNYDFNLLLLRVDVDIRDTMPLITAISTKPTFVTPEEHRELIASTPNSFSDIPPVLRYSEDNVKVIIDPPLDGFLEQDSESGTLYIIERSKIFAMSIVLLTTPQRSCILINIRARVSGTISEYYLTRY